MDTYYGGSACVPQERTVVATGRGRSPKGVMCDAVSVVGMDHGKPSIDAGRCGSAPQHIRS